MKQSEHTANRGWMVVHSCQALRLPAQRWHRYVHVHEHVHAREARRAGCSLESRCAAGFAKCASLNVLSAGSQAEGGSVKSVFRWKRENEKDGDTWIRGRERGRQEKA